MRWLTYLRVKRKEIADKYFRRTLTLLREPIINQIAKKT
jgi:hypothetical protein